MVEIRKILQGLPVFGLKNVSEKPSFSRASIQTSLLSFKDFCSVAELKATGVSMTDESTSGGGFCGVSRL